MGRWLASLRSAEKNRTDARNTPDKTDETSLAGVSSVSSVSSGGVSENFRRDSALSSGGFVSFVSARSGANAEICNAPQWDDDDRQAAFDERAGILEFDAGFSREEAERLAAAEIAEMMRVLH